MMRHIKKFSEQRKNLFFVSDLFQYKNIQTSRFQCFVLCDQNKCHWMKHMIIFCHWHEMSRYVFIMANISTVYGCVVWYRCPLTTSNPSKQVQVIGDMPVSRLWTNLRPPKMDLPTTPKQFSLRNIRRYLVFFPGPFSS